MLVVRFKFTCHERLKLAIKSLGGKWDDLCNGWIFDVYKSPELLRILAQEAIQHTKFEITLPKTYLDTPPRNNAMYGKYASLVKKVNRDEDLLLEQVERYAKRRPLDENEHLPNAFHLFKEEPKKTLPELQYHIELGFYNQFKEIDRLRKEIEQLHKELLDLEKR